PTWCPIPSSPTGCTRRSRDSSKDIWGVRVPGDGRPRKPLRRSIDKGSKGGVTVLREKLSSFWQRLTEGLTLQDLWIQFRKETTAGYRHYAKELTPAKEEGDRRNRWWKNVRAVFWAIFDKLSPTRRVVLLVALATSVFGAIDMVLGDYRLSVDFRSL